MSADLFDTSPSGSEEKVKEKKVTGKKAKPAAKKAKPVAKADSGKQRGRVPAARTVKIRERIMELLKGKRNGVPNAELAAEMKITSGECLKLAQTLIQNGKVVVLREAGSKFVTLKKA